MDYLDVMKSEKDESGVSVWLGDAGNEEKYHVHSIFERGTPEDSEGGFTMWSWVNHLRHKKWWSSSTERDFIDEVSKYL